MTAKSDKGRPSDGPQQPKTRRGGPKRDPNATGGEKLLKLRNILLWEPKRHYQADLAERLVCSGQTAHRCIATSEQTLTGPLRFYQLVQPAAADTLEVSDEEVRYLALCRDLAKPFLQQEAHNSLGQTQADLTTRQIVPVLGLKINEITTSYFNQISIFIKKSSKNLISETYKRVVFLTYDKTHSFALNNFAIRIIKLRGL